VGEPPLAVMRWRARNGTADTGAGMEPKDKHQESYNRPDQMFSSPAGSSRINEAPPSGRFSAQSWPPSSVTMPQETERPSPLPSPGALVVKNGSKIRGISSAGIPGPVSRTSRQTRAVRPAAHRQHTRPGTLHHRLVRVLHEVQEHLLELVLVPQHMGARRELGDDLHVVQLELVALQLEYPA